MFQNIKIAAIGIVRRIYLFISFIFANRKRNKIGKTIDSIIKNKEKIIFDYYMPHMGMCAQLNVLIYTIAFCEKRQITNFGIRFTSENYGGIKSQESWLNHFFISKHINSDNGYIIRNLRHAIDLPGMREIIDNMTINRAHKLFKKYIEIHPNIKDKISKFRTHHLPDKYIAIHYRGTDKAIEAKRINYKHMLNTIKKYLDNFSEINFLYVATDENKFVDFCHSEFNNYHIVNQDMPRSDNNKPIHIKSTSQAEAIKSGESALFDLLMLSTSSALFRTPSFFSGWASVLNPCLPVQMIGIPESSAMWFPDSEIVKLNNDKFDLIDDCI